MEPVHKGENARWGQALALSVERLLPLPLPLPPVRFHAFRFMYLYITIRVRFREPSIHPVYFVSTE